MSVGPDAAVHSFCYSCMPSYPLILSISTFSSRLATPAAHATCPHSCCTASKLPLPAPNPPSPLQSARPLCHQSGVRWRRLPASGAPPSLPALSLSHYVTSMYPKTMTTMRLRQGRWREVWIWGLSFPLHPPVDLDLRSPPLLLLLLHHHLL